MLALAVARPVLRRARLGLAATRARWGAARSAAGAWGGWRATSTSSVAGASEPPLRAPAGAAGAEKAAAPRGITPRATSYSKWYLEVLESAQLVDASPVKGCMVIRPRGFAIWERLQRDLDARIKATGVENAYFPLLVPLSFFAREAQHVDGFAKECAVVTHHRLRATPPTPSSPSSASSPSSPSSPSSSSGLEPDPDSRLGEPLVIRPTSETMIWNSFRRWVGSHRDLPLCLNQWANVVRWEMRTRPFLRTSEFLWQEGHTAHATEAEARARAEQMLGVYRDFVGDLLALPVIPGCKSPSERFAGALDTWTIEAMMQNGWALQAGTSHFLGQNFAKAFDVQFFDTHQTRQFVWATSWGASTRLMGALIMTHSDDVGLVLPPRVAPVQVRILTLAADAAVRAAAAQLCETLTRAGIRVDVDEPSAHEGHLGRRRYACERQGIPLRVELGARELAAGHASVVPRVGRLLTDDATGERVGGPGARVRSLALPLAADARVVVERVTQWLDALQSGLYQRAAERLRERTLRCDSWDQVLAHLTPSTARTDEDADKAAAAAAAAEAAEDASTGGWHADADPGLASYFFLVPWHDDAEAEARVKAETKLTIRCFPLEGQEEARGKKCAFSGREATHMAIFARAY